MLLVAIFVIALITVVVFRMMYAIAGTRPGYTPQRPRPRNGDDFDFSGPALMTGFMAAHPLHTPSQHTGPHNPADGHRHSPACDHHHHGPGCDHRDHHGSHHDHGHTHDGGGFNGGGFDSGGGCSSDGGGGCDSGGGSN